MDFKRTQGLKKDSDFRKVYKHGKSFANRNLVMYILDNKSDSTRVGISVSKKVGNAINRNKIRRRIKESYRLNIDANVKYGYDIVFIARVASCALWWKFISCSCYDIYFLFCCVVFIFKSILLGVYFNLFDYNISSRGYFWI